MDVGRFEVRRRLGAGASGEVFYAIDRQTGESVALKLLRKVGADELLRFKTEFRALQDLAHPHVVHFGEFFRSGEDWFFTMELVEGTDLADWLAPPQSADESVDTLELHCDERSVREAFAQLCDALAAIHAAGLVHRDVKPSNVRVTPRGRVVLLDFGLVTESLQAEDGSVVGTPLYMAPEQARAGPVGPAADMYAVGVMLFEALTGAPPFTGNPLHLLVRKQQLDAPAPRELVPQVPEDLDELCVALLARDPAARPDAQEVAGRLRRVERAVRKESRPRPVFVGRRQEIQVLHQEFDGQGLRVVLVQGSSGIGKTALVTRFLDELQDRDHEMLVFRGRCYEHENVPFKGFDAMVDGLGRWLRRAPVDLVRAVLPEQAALLGQMFPVLGQVLAVRSAPLPPLRDPILRREMTLEVLFDLLSRLAKRHRLVLVLDDAQWIDAEGLLLLEGMARAAPDLLLLCIARDDDELPPEVGKVVRAVATRRLRLGRLDTVASEELACALLGPAGAASLAARAQGHPLFLSYMAELVEQGRSDAVHDLQTVLRARVEQLDSASRRLLAVASLATRPLSAHHLIEAAKLSPELGSRARKALRIGRLLRRLPGARLEPTHDLIRGAGAAGLSERERQGVHAALAQVFERHEPDPELLAFHFSEAGEGAKAADYALEAGHRAAKALAFHRAASFFRDALRWHPARPWDETRPIYAALGDALANAGRGAEAGEAYMRAVHGAPEREARRLRLEAARTFLQSGRLDRGREIARTVLRSAGLRLPSSAAGALASVLYHRGRVRLRGTRFVPREEAEIPRRDLERLDTAVALAAAVSHVDYLQGADLQARGLLLALRCGERSRVARALATEAATKAAVEAPPMRRARELLAQAEAIAAELDDPFIQAYVHLARAAAVLPHMSFREALAEARAADALLRAECTGAVWELSTAHHIIGMCLWNLGRYRELATVVPGYLREARERSDLYGTTTITAGAWAAHFLAADDPKTGLEVLEAAMAEWAQTSFQIQHYFALQAGCELELYLGGGDAFDRIEAARKPLRRSLLTTMPVVSFFVSTLRARAALDVARTNPSRRAEFIERAARALRRARRTVPSPAARGQLAAIEGAIVHARGDRPRALGLLRSAAEQLSAADMEGFASALRWRIAALTGDGPLQEASAQWLRDHGVVRPERYSAARWPGVW